MNEQIARRVQKLMKINLKMEHPPDSIMRFAAESINLDNRINGITDKEVIDILISKHELETTSIGVVYHLLTSSDNQEVFSKMLKYIVGAGVDYWHLVLCNLNMVLIEMWHLIHLGCKEQLVRLIREGIRNNVRQIENVLMNVFRNINGTGDWSSKTRLLNMLIGTIRDHEMWFKSMKSCTGLTVSIIIVVSHIVVDTPQPITKEDTFRPGLIQFLAWIIRSRKLECSALGRDFVIILTRLGRIPQFEELWRDLNQNPTAYGVSSIEEMLCKPNQLPAYRLSVELHRKIDYIVNVGGKNLMTYYDWMFKKHLRQIDGGSLRAEIVRYLIAMNLDPKQPVAYENRIQLLHLIISTSQSGAEQQWLKCCLFVEWFGCDERFLNGMIPNVEVALNLIRYSMLIQAPPPSMNSIIQGSCCSPFANSLLEYICKSVDFFMPSASEQIRKNVNTAMRICRDRFQNTLSQILENHKIDRKISEMMRGIWPDFMRPLPTAMVPPKKKKPVAIEEKKPVESPVQNNLVVESPVERPRAISVDRRKSLKEREEKEKADLESSILLLKGDIKAKIEGLRTQWKDFSDDADKCEAVESLLMMMFKNDDNLDDSQQEIAAQCLLSIIGSVVSDDKSLLPDEKETTEAFTHPIYSILKMLCDPPSEEQSAGDVMTNLMAAMREKDSTLTYVFLYYIKGAERPQEGIECYKDVARVIDKNVDEMLAFDLQLCAINDTRLFGYLVPFVFSHFEEEVMESPELFSVLCLNLDASQLRTFISDIVREEIKLFRKDTFTSTVMASVEWPTTPQWIFWQLVHADGVPIEWFIPIIPKLETMKHDEAIVNILLMLKHMDREPWPGLVRAIFTRLPVKNDNFTTDALKVLIDDADQCQRVAELVGGLIKKLLSNNEIDGIGVKQAKKGAPFKVTLQQVLEHLQLFSDACIQKKQRTTENFMSKHYMQEAFAAVKSNDRSSRIFRKYHHLFGVMDILAQDAKEQNSRTLRGNRQGSASSGSSTNEKQQKRKATDSEDDRNSKKRKIQNDVILLDESDSD